MESLMLRLSDSSHTSSPPSGSKPASNCRLIPLLSTPASVDGHCPTDSGLSRASVVQNIPKNNRQALSPHSDLSSVLKGVIAYVDVRTECDNRSRAIESVLRQLGAEVSSKLSKDVTHVVFKDGRKRTRDVALRRRLHFVSVLWLVKCKELCTRVSESDYPVAPPSHTPLPYGRYKRYRSMQPKSVEEEEADSAKKIQRRQARAKKQKQLQTPSPQQRPHFLSEFFVFDTQPRLDLLADSDSNESSSSLTVPDTPPSLRQRLLAKPRGNCSDAVIDTPTDALQRKLFSVADSPSIDDEAPESARTCATSHLSPETSAADQVQGGVSTSSPVSLRPLVSVALPQSSIVQVQTTASGPAPSESITVGPAFSHSVTVAFAEVTSNTSVPLVTTEPGHEVVWQADTSLPRSEATEVPQSFLGLDRSSPEIDILPVLKRYKVASDYKSVRSSAEFADKLQSARSSVCNDDGASTVEPSVSRSATYRCGSPGLDDDGEFSPCKPKPVTESQSNTSGGVKLIPLSQIRSTSISSDTAAERQPVKLSHVDPVSTETTDKKFFNNRMRSGSFRASSEQADSVPVPKAAHRRSTRLRIPESCVKHSAISATKSVKFNITVGNAQPADKENVCIQKTIQTVPSRQPPQQQNEEILHPSAKTQAGSCNSSFSGEESDVSSGKVRRSFIKRARLDIEPTNQLRLPTSWERHTDSSPVTGRRMSDRVKQKESDAKPTECRKSPGPVAGRKRSASSSSSGLSSCEKTSTKKVVRTIAMTSLHSDEQSMVRSVVSKLGRDFVVSDSVVESTTHVVCGGNRRTIKLLMGIARGCWIISKDWVVQSEAEGCWLSEEPFELLKIFPVAQISRLEKNKEGTKYRQKLFASVGNVYIAENTVPPRRDLVQLVGLCGGEVTSCLRKARVCVGQQNRKNVVSVSEQWVLDSITQHKCLLFDSYRVAA